MKVLIGLSILLSSFFSPTPDDKIIGQYWVEGKTGKIEIYNCGDEYCGKIIWRADTRKDVKNPDKTLRNRSVIGITFLKNFIYQVNNEEWTDGTVYSIDNGKTYSGKLWLEDNGQTLKMRGFIGLSLFGRTATLKRVEK